MVTAVHLTLAEYLLRKDEPECELIAGELVPKPIGTLEHMQMEKRLSRLLEPFELRGMGQVLWELSFCNGAEVRVPDVAFVLPDARFEAGILIDAPLLCIEILSPSQRQSELFAKCELYHSWGVPYCWVVDPIAKRAWEYHRDSGVCRVPDGGELRADEIKIPVLRVFE
jgi:Uma2 family endonuclease